MDLFPFSFKEWTIKPWNCVNITYLLTTKNNRDLHEPLIINLKEDSCATTGNLQRITNLLYSLGMSAPLTAVYDWKKFFLLFLFLKDIGIKFRQFFPILRP